MRLGDVEFRLDDVRLACRLRSQRDVGACLRKELSSRVVWFDTSEGSCRLDAVT